MLFRNKTLLDFLHKTPLIKDLHYFLLFRYHMYWNRIIRGREQKKVIQVEGLRRSGNHAIIHWIMRQENGLVHFCNDISPEEAPDKARTKETERKASLKGNQNKACLIYSFEDQPTDRTSDYIDRSRSSIGPYRNFYRVLILRNPYNLFASRARSEEVDQGRFSRDREFRNRIVSLWKQHARFFLEIRKAEKEGVVPIEYDRWCQDRNYRAHIAEKLELNFTDASFNELAGYGGGSSFDQEFRPKKKVKDRTNRLERWKAIAEDPVHADIFRDEELKSLTQAIFSSHAPS